MAERRDGWKLVDPAGSRYQAEGGPKDEWVGAAVSSSRARSRAMGSDPGNDRALPRPPRATLITDFYSYNTNMSADSSNLLDDVQDGTRKVHGCSLTGSAI